MSTIYVINIPTARKTYYKIGRTQNLKYRLKGYDSYHIWGYKLIYTLIFDRMTDDEQLLEIERGIHKEFESHRIKPRYEWFRFKDSQLKMLKCYLESLANLHDAQLVSKDY